ncbi:hypothetical protein CBR_g56634 [Chara braunii]|uniref:DUF659 domain-containing protein n=1 Tax=Chara braunii TaxID=69332 RepID=A0A388MDW5_CHABU|nr:hypothetical protein CBR_g56634 [Chara braunii]|eukprot:GBG92669.1 hypothetical protein CBR_g56634 [Chara braunii]
MAVTLSFTWLQSRGMGVELICNCCNWPFESTRHLWWECPASKRIRGWWKQQWEEMGGEGAAWNEEWVILGFLPENLAGEKGKEGWGYIAHVVRGIICEIIWVDMNKTRFEKKTLSDTEIKRRIKMGVKQAINFDWRRKVKSGVGNGVKRRWFKRTWARSDQLITVNSSGELVFAEDRQRDAELKFVGFKWMQKGQRLPGRNGNFVMKCKLCDQEFVGSQSKCALHYTIKNNCPQAMLDVLAEIWNKSAYHFDQRHWKKIHAYLAERGWADKRREHGQQGGDSGEEDEDDPERVAEEENEQAGRECEALESGGVQGGRRANDDRSAEVSIDVEREAERDRGALRGDKRAVTGIGTSTKRRTSSQPLPPTGAAKKFRQLRMESFDPKWKQDLDTYFLQWFYVSGIPFHAAGRPEYNTFRRHLATCPPRVHPTLPNHRRISGDGIVQQHKDVAERLATLRRDVAAIGATILTDGRKSITADQIVNFLAAGSSGAYLLRTVQSDGAEQDTTTVVVRRWKKVFNDFGLENVNAICTDSAGTYVAAAKLLAQDKDLRYSRITWLPCASSWVRQQIRFAAFWEDVEAIVELMTPVMQLLRRLDRGGRVMSSLWSWSKRVIQRVAQAPTRRTSRAELDTLVRGLQARRRHMLEPAHCMSHLLNPRHKSIAYFEGACRTDHERELAEEADIYLRQQTGPDRQLYQDFRIALREFHSREGDCAYGGRDGDRDADTCRGEKETSAVAKWWVQWGDGVPLLQSIAVKRRNKRRTGLSTRGVGYVLPWEDEDVVTEEESLEPRDSGVRTADKVTDEQLDRQVREGRKDSLTRQAASVERYFGRRATILLPHEEDAVYDPEPDPLMQDEIEEEPWFDPDDLDAESGRLSDDDAPLSQMRRETRGSTSARPRPSPRPRDGVVTGPAVVGRPGRADAQCQGLSNRQRQHTSIDSDSDDDDGGYEGSSEFEDDKDFDSGAGDAPRGADVETDVDRRDREERQRALALAQSCPVTQDIRASLDAAHALETGVALVAETYVPDSCGTGVRTHGVDEVEERDASRPTQGDGSVCRPGLRPIGGEDDDVEGGGDGAVGGGGGPYGESEAVVLECEGREDPLTDDRRGRMEDACRRALGDPPPYVPCSPSVPSSMTGVSPPPWYPMAQMESIRAACAANTRSWDSGRGGSESHSSVGGTQLAEGRGLGSLSPQSRMKTRPHGLGFVRKVTQAMRDMQLGLAAIPASMRPPPLPRGGDVEVDAAGWGRGRIRGSRLDSNGAGPPTQRIASVTGASTQRTETAAGGARALTTLTADDPPPTRPPDRGTAGHILKEDVWDRRPRGP